MNFNYQKARDLMVENQLRPNKINDPVILELFKAMPKENFLPNEIKDQPYSDLDITLVSHRGYLKNLHIAQLINYAEINKTHKVLHLGALTGYVTTMLANLSSEVFAVESNDKLKLLLKKNINKFNNKNIKIVEGSFKYGFKDASPFDRIFIDTPIRKIEDILLEQLNNNAGKIIMIKKDKGHLSQAIKITKNYNNLSHEYLFDVFSQYQLFEEKEGFIF